MSELQKDSDELITDFTKITRKLLRLFSHYTEELEKVKINLDGLSSPNGPPPYGGSYTIDDVYPILTDFIQVFEKYELAHGKVK